MKGLKYSLETYGSVLDFTHGFTKTITEIFVPKENIIFNAADNVLHAWDSIKSRCPKDVKSEEVSVDSEFVGQLKKLIQLQGNCLVKAKTYFPEK